MYEPLTVYTLPNCMQCEWTKRALTTAPIVTIGTASWSGFRPDKIRAVATAHPTTVNPIETPTVPACSSGQHERESG